MIRSGLEVLQNPLYPFDLFPVTPFQSEMAESLEKENCRFAFSTTLNIDDTFFQDKFPGEEGLMREKFEKEIEREEDSQNQFLVTNCQVMRADEKVDQNDQGGDGQREENIKKKETNKRMKINHKARKNFLTVMKKCILNKWSSMPKTDDQFLSVFAENKNKTNRQEFEQLFQQGQIRGLLAKMFYHGDLKRELQLSRINPENRRMFAEEILLLKRSLITKKLPRL